MWGIRKREKKASKKDRNLRCLFSNTRVLVLLLLLDDDDDAFPALENNSLLEEKTKEPPSPSSTSVCFWRDKSRGSVDECDALVVVVVVKEVVVEYKKDSFRFCRRFIITLVVVLDLDNNDAASLGILEADDAPEEEEAFVCVMNTILEETKVISETENRK